MKKNEIRAIAFVLIVLIAFNVVVFALPFVMNGVFWVSYIFGMLAILLQLPVMKIAFKNGSSVKSKFYGFPIARIGAIYAITQLVVSLIFMLLAHFLPVWLPVVVCVLLVCVSGAGFIGADTMRDEVEHQDIKLEADVKFIRSLQSKASFIATQCKDDEVKRAVSAYADNLRYSDPVSNSKLTEIENELLIYTNELENAVIDNDKNSALSLCQKTESLLAERNHLCKVNKNNS